MRLFPSPLPLLLAFCCWLPFAAGAQQSRVALVGMLGSKALLVIDGSQPHSLGVGQVWQGVKLISLAADQAVIESGGKRQILLMGVTPALLQPGANPNSADDGRIVLGADSLGHFVTRGQINNRSTMMMIDTGATMIALPAALAKQLGINYSGAPVQQSSTANGMVKSWRIKLDRLRVGTITMYGVDAVVLDGDMPYVLLGNSFLGRFDMSRNNNQMVLQQRF